MNRETHLIVCEKQVNRVYARLAFSDFSPFVNKQFGLGLRVDLRGLILQGLLARRAMSAIDRLLRVNARTW